MLRILLLVYLPHKLNLKQATVTTTGRIYMPSLYSCILAVTLEKGVYAVMLCSGRNTHTHTHIFNAGWTRHRGESESERCTFLESNKTDTRRFSKTALICFSISLFFLADKTQNKKCSKVTFTLLCRHI